VSLSLHRLLRLRREMKNGFFVTGTDTNVGKTIVAAAICCVLRSRHKAICYWKPVQTGIEQDNDTLEVKKLANCADAEILNAGVRLEKPLSPHLSARLANFEIKIKDILQIWKNSKSAIQNPQWIVEGAGGLLVPLNEKDLMIDLMAKLNLPVIVTARSSLGTINHTLLTIEALRRRNLAIAGVVMNGEPNAENRRAIEFYGDVRVLGEMPVFAELNFSILNAWAQENLKL
jgi:dethiobiotin synthetase